MSWVIVPLNYRNFGFFDGQRDLFSDWISDLDKEWRALDHLTRRSRFDEELDRMRRDMFRLESGPLMLQREQPFVTDAEGNTKLALRYDCSGFQPEEITVKQIEDKLVVHAKHESESPGSKVYKEFTKEFTIPKEVDPAKLKSTLTNDGVLCIEAPVTKQEDAPKEVLVPIERMCESLSEKKES